MQATSVFNHGEEQRFQGKVIWGGGLTGSAVGVGIPGFFMEY